ncbi:MAG TPA: hypothetical protein PKE12_06165 [Kiritimatiellia bacterium]|nr:hypothetical protein [Kiritimatiellia bacterium]
MPTLPAPTAHPAIAPDAREKYSSAATLSDMEIFVFPELLYGLVLANIMSPRLWRWRDDPWFAGIHKMTPYRRVLRLKQFIIDHYEFNLDLDTWGLTTKERELARFAPYIDEETVSRSNALFGYEGDKYYFDLDIRRHFGLDKYEGNVIPYWKTETLEAMDAFREKPGFTRGAGECVSLSTLYAAALFVVCGVPLDNIYLLATPLHSQNFIDLGDGVLTNNRRLVTKNMWFNGTEQTAKAQRALRHEQVTIVAHHTGYIHCVYPEATIAPAVYEQFGASLRRYLTTHITMEIMANFLRDQSALQKCFQIRHDAHGKSRYIPAERVYAYEHNSSYKVSDATREKLLNEIDEDEFFPELLPDRLLLNKFDEFFKKGQVDISKPADIDRLAAALDCQCSKSRDVVTRLVQFARLEPKLPHRDGHTRFVPGPTLDLKTEMSRDEIVAHLESIRDRHPSADLAFYAARDFSRIDWTPVVQAAIERNPVTVKALEALGDREAVERVLAIQDVSIYDGPRVAQPDEVWNYQRGDGLERLLCVANIWKARHPDARLTLNVEPDRATLSGAGGDLTLPHAKGIAGRIDV